jgi:hypothetical protein
LASFAYPSIICPGQYPQRATGRIRPLARIKTGHCWIIGLADWGSAAGRKGMSALSQVTTTVKANIALLDGDETKRPPTKAALHQVCFGLSRRPGPAMTYLVSSSANSFCMVFRILSSSGSLFASREHGKHFAETKSQRPDRFSPCLYRSRILVERFFKDQANLACCDPIRQLAANNLAFAKLASIRICSC